MSQNYCADCAVPIPDGQKFCLMCYGDMEYGKDGYYRDWYMQQLEEEENEKRENEERERSPTMTEKLYTLAEARLMMGIEDIVTRISRNALKERVAELLTVMENIRDLARTGLKPDCYETEEQWLRHKVNEISWLSNHEVEKGV